MSTSINSDLSPDITYSFDKLSCLRTMYFAHMVFCYLTFLSGIGAFISRMHSSIKWTHVWFGRSYIIMILWTMATSLVIHNTGLPIATLVSFIWVLGGITIGWIIISIHQTNLRSQATKHVEIGIR